MNLTLAEFVWLPLDTRTVVVGALTAMSCALLGNFLLLRRLSMMGDAISHAVLPGLAAAFILTGSRGSATMLIGAAIAGVLTAALTEWVRRAGRVDEGSSMGVVFTILFAAGLILIRRAADSVDLDPDCVLYGAIETVDFYRTRVGNFEIPTAALSGAVLLAANAALVALFYKELKISAFDPALATTMGINASAMHYVLMTLVAVTTVVAFESVGSILVIAMLIVPPATAHLLTDRLGPMILLSLLFAAIAAAAGHLGAITLPPLVGFNGVSTNTAGMMGVAAGLMFAAAMFLSPRYGVISRLVHRIRLSLQIASDDILGLLYRIEERGAAARSDSPLPIAMPPVSRRAILHSVVHAGPLLGRAALARLVRSGLLRAADGGYVLTDSGRAAARCLVRSHRLWESYLEKHVTIPTDHLHLSAGRLEHVITPAMQAELAESVDDARHDPHGREIPTD